MSQGNGSRAWSRTALVMAPVSPAIARLLHQLQAQILQELQAQIAPTADPMGDLQDPVASYDDDDTIEYCAANGTDRYRRQRFCPDSWRDGGVPWHASHWRLYRTRIDSAGRSWQACDISQVHVMDDFGYLVPVEGAQ